MYYGNPNTYAPGDGQPCKEYRPHFKQQHENSQSCNGTLTKERQPRSDNKRIFALNSFANTNSLYILGFKFSAKVSKFWVSRTKGAIFLFVFVQLCSLINIIFFVEGIGFNNMIVFRNHDIMCEAFACHLNHSHDGFTSESIELLIEKIVWQFTVQIGKL